MLRHFDRKGTPIDWRKAGELLEDRSYAVVKQTSLDNGYWVSTVWLGLDHGFGDDGPPLIFETMVFERYRGAKKKIDFSDMPNWNGPKKPWVMRADMSDLDCERYPTEEAALAGHRQMVEKWRQAKPEKAPWSPAVYGDRIPRKLKKRLKKDPEMWRRYFP
jgi:hypothetical protein